MKTLASYFEDTVVATDSEVLCECCGRECRGETVDCDLCGARCCGQCVEDQYGYRVCRNCLD